MGPLVSLVSVSEGQLERLQPPGPPATPPPSPLNLLPGIASLLLTRRRGALGPSQRGGQAGRDQQPNNAPCVGDLPRGATEVDTVVPVPMAGSRAIPGDLQSVPGEGGRAGPWGRGTAGTWGSCRDS